MATTETLQPRLRLLKRSGMLDSSPRAFRKPALDRSTANVPHGGIAAERMDDPRRESNASLVGRTPGGYLPAR